MAPFVVVASAVTAAVLVPAVVVEAILVLVMTVVVEAILVLVMRAAVARPRFRGDRELRRPAARRRPKCRQPGRPLSGLAIEPRLDPVQLTIAGRDLCV